MIDCDLPERHRRRAAGFTMIEATASVAIVGILLVVATQGLGVAIRSSRAQQNQQLRTALAAQLLAEVMQTHYSDPNVTPVFGAESGESSRALFNDVDDYNGYTESPPTDRTGTALSGYTGWKRQVKVEWVSVSSPNTASGSNTGLKRVAVTVTSSDGKSTTLYGFRSQTGIYEKTPASQTTYVTWIGIRCQVGTSDTKAASGGTTAVNLTP